MKNIFKRTTALVLFLTILLSLCACGKSESETTTSALPQTTTAPAPKEENFNRLTGLDNLSKKAKGKRPVAVMINNINVSLPQYGIGKADLMFECLVEGGITRMMAVYADYTKIPNVCSIRSCRYYFPILAYGLDAVYFCFGSNKSLGTATLERLKIDYIDGSVNTDDLIYARDPERLARYSREHTAYLKGENMPEILKKYKIRTDYKEGKDKYIFDFQKPAKISSVACDEATLVFSNAYYSTFKYDSEKKVYLKEHSGSPHMDSSTGKQLSYVNVFALETDISLYDGGPLVEMNWKGGTGYYISRGTIKKITWTKADEASSIVVKDKSGNEIKVNRGNSYFGFVNSGKVELSSSTKEALKTSSAALTSSAATASTAAQTTVSVSNN